MHDSPPASWQKKYFTAASSAISAVNYSKVQHI